MTLRAKLMDPGSSGAGKTVYAHVMTALHEYEDEVLDVCLFGVGDNSEAALVESSIIWITGVAGPIKSFLDDKPVCMSRQAGFPTAIPQRAIHEATMVYLGSAPSSIRLRAELDRTICYFAENFSKHDSVDRLIETMLSRRSPDVNSFLLSCSRARR